ncbi:hypothetical protein [Halomonas sp. BM-2019]|uniref:hypothetical protein n=1 Tax=Halomonas sp. BM-2019 TaxID=2811227 RepID=UPI001B3C1F52|nr:MAG: hypothetical protein J5F18_18285 [Halomonas sp. BM-2019]
MIRSPSTRREMEVRGFTYVEDPAEAQLLINFHIDLAERFQVRSTTIHWRGTSFWNYRRGLYAPGGVTAAGRPTRLSMWISSRKGP